MVKIVPTMYPTAMPLKNILPSHRDDILKLASKWGAFNIRVFGSIARGEENEQSDLDLLVELEPGRTLFDLGGFVTDVERLLGRKVDAVTEPALHWYIRDRILQEAVRL